MGGGIHGLHVDLLLCTSFLMAGHDVVQGPDSEHLTSVPRQSSASLQHCHSKGHSCIRPGRLVSYEPRPIKYPYFGATVPAINHISSFPWLRQLVIQLLQTMARWLALWSTPAPSLLQEMFSWEPVMARRITKPNQLGPCQERPRRKLCLGFL